MPDVLVTDTYKCEARHQKFTAQMRVAEDVPEEVVDEYLTEYVAHTACPVTGEHFTPDQRVSRTWRALT